MLDDVIRFNYSDLTILARLVINLNNDYSAAMDFETASTLTAENLNSGILP